MVSEQTLVVVMVVVEVVVVVPIVVVPEIPIMIEVKEVALLVATIGGLFVFTVPTDISVSGLKWACCISS
jgi:hypothetical protein